jgi:hypothetical protein
VPERGFTIPAEDVEAALGRGVLRAVMPEAKPAGSETEKPSAEDAEQGPAEPAKEQ